VFVEKSYDSTRSVHSLRLFPSKILSYFFTIFLTPSRDREERREKESEEREKKKRVTCSIEFSKGEEIRELEIDVFELGEVAQSEIGVVRLVSRFPFINHFLDTYT
jgi:hypothetical protein